MKLLTLNTHSLEEENMAEKQHQFVEFVLREQPDIIALQEVNQTIAAEAYHGPAYGLHQILGNVSLHKDNHALQIARLLHEGGQDYHWVWLPAKIGYSKYDEGLALFSKKPIISCENLLASVVNEYENYRTRRIPGIRTEDGWFYSVHLSWWNDPDEPFIDQWTRLQPVLNAHKSSKLCVLMGDFNSDARIAGESADAVAASGFFDTYVLADEKDGGMTVGGLIDGWENQPEKGPKRIDQIWLSEMCPVKNSRVIFNGENEPVVSDHYGVLVELDLKQN